MPDAPTDITPDSKLGDLLDRWPALEQVLVAISPHFAALKNPVLRRTVAKVATLRHASSVSGVPLGELIGKLRAAAGLSPRAFAEERDAAPPDRPAWADARAAVRRTYDAGPDIAAGEHPAKRVITDLAALSDGEVYLLLTPFFPSPLIERARTQGFVSWSVEADGVVQTFFRRG